MCGRYTLHSRVADLRRLLPGVDVPGDLAPRYNIAPTQEVAVVPSDGSRAVAFFRWGLIPSWARDASLGARLINARSETVDEKPAFREAFRRRRCLVLADGFYEWARAEGGGPKRPHHVRMRDGRPFAFAGLWETWRPPEGGALRTTTILTTTPNATVAPVHDRMPVILSHASFEAWLDVDRADPADLRALLRPHEPDDMVAVPVARTVGNPRNDGPECLAPP